MMEVINFLLQDLQSCLPFLFFSFPSVDSSQVRIIFTDMSPKQLVNQSINRFEKEYAEHKVLRVICCMVCMVTFVHMFPEVSTNLHTSVA